MKKQAALKGITLLLPVFLLLAMMPNRAQAQYLINTIAGTGNPGSGGDNFAATAAQLNNPIGVTKDRTGNIFIADYLNNKIRKIDLAGTITTYAGTGVQGYFGDGALATSAKLWNPTGVACDTLGNLFITDNGNNRIRKVNASTGVITTVAGIGGSGNYNGDNIAATGAQLNQPFGIALDKAGNIFFGDRNNHRIRKINTSGIITAIAGTGTAGFSGDNGLADSAMIQYPSGGVVVDSIGNVYFSDTYNHRVRKINLGDSISTFAGTGLAAYSGDGNPANTAQLNYPHGLSIDNQGNIYIADYGNNVIRIVTTDGLINSIAGNGIPGFFGDGGLALNAQMRNPMGVFVSGVNVLISDYYNNRIRILTPCQAPVNASGGIIGNTLVCPGSSQIYSIAPILGATSYTWTYPSGWTGGSATDSITFITGNNGGTISVTGNNVCGSTTPQNLIVTMNSVPSQPVSITGNTSFCLNSNQTYSIATVPGATSYSWTLPNGWTGTSSSETINAVASGISGNISVTANNNCGSSIPQTLAVTVNTAPNQPGIISGTTTVCANSSQTYSISPVSGATSYNWTLPSGWSGTSTTNSINATIGTLSGTILVSATNTCGTGIAQSLTIHVDTIPGQPLAITGSTTVCIGTLQNYSVAAVPCATSYTWTLPSGWSGNSSSNSINATVGTTGGTITVTANNSYGNSVVQTLTITTITVPSQPSAIAGNTVFCQNSSQTFSIPSLSGATSYTWTLPNGFSGTSSTNSITATAGVNSGNVTVTANNQCGSSSPQTMAVTVNLVPTQPGTITGPSPICAGSTHIYSISPVVNASYYTWTLPNGWSGTSTTDSITVIAGSASGTILVTAGNSCGNSSPRSISITVTPLPTQPGAIIGNDSVCVGTTQSYSITSVTGATSYIWTVPAGWSINNGQGSTYVTVHVTNVSGIDTIYVKAANYCDTSTAQELIVTVLGIPPIPGSITGPQILCRGAVYTYIAPAVSSATHYSWNLPFNWTGSSTTDTINATPDFHSGNITISAWNACGSSTSLPYMVVVDTSVPLKPDTIIGPLIVCQNTIHTYKTHPVNTATGYTWTLPSGWNDSSTLDSIITHANGASGYIFVAANNACGTGPQDTIYVNVNPAPPIPSINQVGNTLISSSPHNNQWYINHVLQTNDTNQIFTITIPGNYTVVVTNQNGCTSESGPINIITVVIDEINAAKNIHIYPNPNNGNFTLSYHLEAKTMFRITDISGRTIKNIPINENNATQIIEAGDLQNGIYYWDMPINQSIAKGKIVIIR